MRITKFCFTAPVAAALSLCFALGNGCTAKSKLELQRKTLAFSLPDDVKSMDPALAYDSVAMDVIPLVLESLYQYSYTKTPLVLEPLLASGMPEISADQKTVTVHLKPGTLWQDGDFFPGGKGRALTTGDFLYAWKRLALPDLQSPSTWIFDGKVAGWDEFRKNLQAASDKTAALAAPVSGFEAVDDLTLRIHLIRPYPQFTHILAMAYSAPLPHEVFDKYGLFALNERVVGTGPFRFREYVRGSRIVLEKNPSFRGEAYPSKSKNSAGSLCDGCPPNKRIPLVEEVTFRIFKEDQPRWLSFSKGFLDVSGIPKDNFSSVVESGELRGEMAAKGIQFTKMEQASTYVFFFNLKDPVIGKSADLRKAISLAFDRTAFVEKFRNGRGITATSLVPRTVPGHVERPFAYDYNPAKAKEFLAKAGYPGGKGLAPIHLDLKGTATNFREQGEFVRDQLGKVGIPVEVVPNTMPGYLEKERNGNLQFTLGLWDSDYPDAENFLALLYSKNASPGPNISSYRNPAFDRLYEKIALMPVGAERSKLIEQAEDIANADLPIAPLFYPLAFSVGHGWVENFQPNIQIINHMKYFDVDLAKKAELAPRL
ncbi:MAG: ABC transporter substrate-binding protein [Bdellovibrionota bacterium]